MWKVICIDLAKGLERTCTVHAEELLCTFCTFPLFHCAYRIVSFLHVVTSFENLLILGVLKVVSKLLYVQLPVEGLTGIKPTYGHCKAKVDEARDFAVVEQGLTFRGVQNEGMVYSLSLVDV